MNHQIELADAEWGLVLELLENERRELHPEVRRSTMNVEAHQDLQNRLKLVDELIGRLQGQPPRPS